MRYVDEHQAVRCAKALADAGTVAALPCARCQSGRRETAKAVLEAREWQLYTTHAHSALSSFYISASELLVLRSQWTFWQRCQLIFDVAHPGYPQAAVSSDIVTELSYA